jgi:hypothetical protein
MDQIKWDRSIHWLLFKHPMDSFCVKVSIGWRCLETLPAVMHYYRIYIFSTKTGFLEVLIFLLEERMTEFEPGFTNIIVHSLSKCDPVKQGSQVGVGGWVVVIENRLSWALARVLSTRTQGMNPVVRASGRRPLCWTATDHNLFHMLSPHVQYPNKLRKQRRFACC